MKKLVLHFTLIARFSSASHQVSHKHPILVSTKNLLNLLASPLINAFLFKRLNDWLSKYDKMPEG